MVGVIKIYNILETIVWIIFGLLVLYIVFKYIYDMEKKCVHNEFIQCKENNDNIYFKCLDCGKIMIISKTKIPEECFLNEK